MLTGWFKKIVIILVSVSLNKSSKFFTSESYKLLNISNSNVFKWENIDKNLGRFNKEFYSNFIVLYYLKKSLNF